MWLHAAGTHHLAPYSVSVLTCKDYYMTVHEYDVECHLYHIGTTSANLLGFDPTQKTVLRQLQIPYQSRRHSYSITVRKHPGNVLLSLYTTKSVARSSTPTSLRPDMIETGSDHPNYVKDTI